MALLNKAMIDAFYLWG